MIKWLKKIPSWILDIVLLRPYEVDPGPKVTPNPPPWDVPLDQTTAGMRYEDETDSV